MRAAWGMLVAVGAFAIVAVMVASMASEYIDQQGALLGHTGRQVNMATLALERMRSLIGELQVR